MDSEIALLEELITVGQEFTWETFSYPNEDYPEQYAGEDTPEWIMWKTRAMNVVKRVAAGDSPGMKLVEEGIAIGTKGNPSTRFERAKATILKGLEITFEAKKADSYGELRAPITRSVAPTLSNRVFVVHGHDSALKTDVERFLHELGLEPVVLHRKPNEGATIIEKFEKHSDVGYAFVLLTPDEIAYTASQDANPDDEREKERRARPNVIFEFGYFVASLGRPRVCALVKGKTTLPSDLSGIIYKHVEDNLDSVAYSIIQELKAAGYAIRM